MYEKHRLTAAYPMRFVNHERPYMSYFVPHWHENIEIINITEGSARVILNSREVRGGVGTTFVVNSGYIHQYFSTKGTLKYHCLIISVEFLKQLGLDFTDIEAELCVNDDNITRLFASLGDIVKQQKQYYKPESIAEALKIATMLMREHTVRSGIIAAEKNNKTELVKKSISYLRNNFEKQLTLDTVCSEVGVSKYYLCHAFKDVTKMTFTKMLNYIRCQEAKRLFLNSEANVCEAARKCGYENMSYFTKTYKSVMGCLPSEDMRNPGK